MVHAPDSLARAYGGSPEAFEVLTGLDRAVTELCGPSRPSGTAYRM